MKKNLVFLMGVIIVLSMLLFTACNDKEEENSIVINNIEVMTNAKLLAESKEIELNDVPESLRYLSLATETLELSLSNIFAVYTKSNASKEEFDTPHDYKFIFSSEDKTAVVSVSELGAPLRDCFFQSTENKSKAYGTEMLFYKFQDKYLVRFEKNGYHFDIETNNLTEYEMNVVVSKVAK